MKTTRLITAFLSVAIAAVGIAGAPLAFAQDNGESQGASQPNLCGNGEEPINSLCQDLASQIQGDLNDVYISGEQDASSNIETEEETEEDASEEDASEEDASEEDATEEDAEFDDAEFE